MFNLIVSDGRVADRTPHTRTGALATAKALQTYYGVDPLYVGHGEGLPKIDNWVESLASDKKQILKLSSALSNVLEEGALVVVVNGTCPASLGTVPPVAAKYPDMKLLWIDAHGDFNTPETTGSGYLGGMVVSALCGLWDSGVNVAISPENVILAGVRDLDSGERLLTDRAQVEVIPASVVAPDLVKDSIGDSKVWIHIDWDVLEPGFVPADYSVSGGLEPLRLRSILEAIPHAQIIGLEIAEFNASCGEQGVRLALEHILDIIDPVLSPSSEVLLADGNAAYA